MSDKGCPVCASPYLSRILDANFQPTGERVCGCCRTWFKAEDLTLTAEELSYHKDRWLKLKKRLEPTMDNAQPVFSQ